MKLKDIYTKLETVGYLKDSYSRHDFYSHLVFDKTIDDLLNDKDKPNDKYNIVPLLSQGRLTGYNKGRQIPLTGERKYYSLMFYDTADDLLVEALRRIKEVLR